jgi:uncharacterized protein (DUF2141 family)
VKNIILIFAGFVIISNCSFSQYCLRIEISGLRNNTGKVMLQVFDEKETVLIREVSEIKEKSCVFTVKNLPAGKYAVRYYHDENLNQEMDTNMVGEPTEGYGFSNNVTGRVGPPPFEKWLFEFNGDRTIVLRPVY